MTKLDGKTPDLAAENIEQLRQIFPDVFEEGKIDFDKLKQVLGEYVDDEKERYNFTWNGKGKALRLAQTPTTGTLRPCPKESESKNWDDTQNLYIEGDNLEVLKLLQKSYHGKIKMIYIDPPYNTGGDFVYPDDFSDSIENYKRITGQVDDEGKQLGTNSEFNGRYHTDWLNMMYPRLRLARNLLSNDGVILISIDDNEQSNLIKICGEIFGESNFVADISWQRTYSPRNDSKGVVSEVEHIVIYSKQTSWMPNYLPRTEEMDAKYKNPDNDIMAWKSSDAFAADASTHQGMVYAIQHPFTGEMIYPYNGAHWRYQQDTMLEIMNGWTEYTLKDLQDAEKRAQICGISSADVRKDVKALVLAKPLEVAQAQAKIVLERGQWPKFYFTQNGKGGIARKTYLDSVGGRLPTNLWEHIDVGHTDEAKKELKNLFNGAAPFDTPKPVRLLDRMLTIATDKDSIVMDFFSGSATTAHAVMKKNCEDGGNRKFILAQLPEKSPAPQYETLCDVGKERIRRAGEKIKAEIEGQNAQLKIGEEPRKVPDIGFKVFKLDSSNLKQWQPDYDDLETTLFDSISNYVEGRSELDVVYEIMLKMGMELTWPLETHTICGKNVYEIGMGALMICLDDHITTEVAEGMAALYKELAPETWRVVFKDNGFADDSAKVNIKEILKTAGLEEDAFTTV